VSDLDGENLTLTCNVCGAVVGSIQVGILQAMEQAIADSFAIRKFDEMDATEVLTSISEECQRGLCEKCSGHFHLPEHGDEPILCVHDCHELKKEPESVN